LLQVTFRDSALDNLGTVQTSPVTPCFRAGYFHSSPRVMDRLSEIATAPAGTTYIEPFTLVLDANPTTVYFDDLSRQSAGACLVRHGARHGTPAVLPAPSPEIDVRIICFTFKNTNACGNAGILFMLPAFESLCWPRNLKASSRVFVTRPMLYHPHQVAVAMPVERLDRARIGCRACHFYSVRLDPFVIFA